MQLHHDQKIERLKELKLFKDADNKALKHLANAADEIHVEAGRDLIKQGTHHFEGYLIMSGSVTAHVDGVQVATIPAGELVGELSLFGHGPASATVTSAEDVVALSIPYNQFDAILDENPSLAKLMAKELAGRLHAMDEVRH